MTMIEMPGGRVVGWSPDDEPESQYDDEHGWFPVLDGHLVVLLPDDDPEKQRAIANLHRLRAGDPGHHGLRQAAQNRDGYVTVYANHLRDLLGEYDRLSEIANGEVSADETGAYPAGLGATALR